MKNVGVIITGQGRTFSQCLPSLHWHLFRHLEHPRFFVSVADDGDASSVRRLRDQYPHSDVVIETVLQPSISEPSPSYAHFAPYPITPTKTPGVGPLQGILRQLWHLSRGYRFAHEHGAAQCETFIRCRPDLHFHRIKFPDREPRCDEAFTPYWGNFGPGVNDRFAFLGRRAADAYFSTYDRLLELLDAGCPFHPETLVGAALDAAGIRIHRTLLAEFSTLRSGGVLELMSVQPGELAEFTIAGWAELRDQVESARSVPTEAL